MRKYILPETGGLIQSSPIFGVIKGHITLFRHPVAGVGHARSRALGKILLFFCFHGGFSHDSQVACGGQWAAPKMVQSFLRRRALVQKSRKHESPTYAHATWLNDQDLTNEDFRQFSKKFELEKEADTPNLQPRP